MAAMETPIEPVPATTEPTPSPNAPRRRHAKGWFTLLVLVIIVLAAWFGWQAWQQRQAGVTAGNAQIAAQKAEIMGLQQQVDGFNAAVSAVDKQRAALRDRLADSEAGNRRLQDQVVGLNERVQQLEAAVTGLSRQQFSGHDGMLLDDAEMLLQLASQRYDVLHDAVGADRALALAAQAMAGVRDASYASVRQAIAGEREALAAVQPVNQQADLDTLTALRAAWPTLPLKPLDTAAPANTGVWQRVWGSVSGMVRIRRDDATELSDARVARQLAVLDLATAQAALLDHDQAAAHAALARVAAALARDLDPAAPAVERADANLDHLLSATGATAAEPVRLGAALAELRNVRGVQAIAPTPAASVPRAAAGATP